MMALRHELALECSVCRRLISPSEAAPWTGYVVLAICPCCGTEIPDWREDRNYRRRAARWIRKHGKTAPWDRGDGKGKDV